MEKNKYAIVYRLQVPMGGVRLTGGRVGKMFENNIVFLKGFELELPRSFRITRYTGGEQIVGKERYAMEYGPLLYAAMGAPNPVTVRWDPTEPEKWFEESGKSGVFTVRGDGAHEYWPYCDIFDEPFSVYPVVEPV